MVAQTRGGTEKSPTKLRFKDKLVGKGLSNDALQKRLKGLHAELAQTDQERVDLDSLAAVREDLINNSLLLHKDKGVKAYTACCLADLLRLYAPDAPYTGRQLKASKPIDIFSFFFRQLAVGIKGPDSPYYNEYFHLLESLSSVKSVVLVCDLPEADELIHEAFRCFFDLVKLDLAKNVEFCMSEILIALVDESQSLPADVLEILMSQFLQKNARMEQPAFRLAVQICNGTADKLQRNVCQYFTDIIVSHTREEDDNEDFESIRTAHRLIKQIHKFCPSLLLNVIPQLEEELRIDELQIRIMATQVLGQMFAEKGGVDLAKKYPSTWKLWLARKNDVSPLVRLAMLEVAKGLLSDSPELSKDIEEVLAFKLLDPDDKVRTAVCRIFSQLDYQTALHHVSEKLLRAVGLRCLDKKVHVRDEAFKGLGQLFRLAYPEIENGDAAAIKHFSWIPNAMLQALQTSLELRHIVEQTVAQYILPFPSKSEDEGAWTDQLLTVMKYLDESAIKPLLIMSGVKSVRPSIYERFLENCIEYNGGTMDDNEDMKQRKFKLSVNQVASLFPDTAKAADHLNTFAKMNEPRLYKLMKICMDPQTDLKTLTKSLAEFLRRIEQGHSNIVPTMTTVLRRCSFWVVNPSSISVLIKRLQREEDDSNLLVSHSHTLLSYIAKHCAAILQASVTEFSKSLADDNETIVEVALQALAAVARVDVESAPTEKRTLDRVMKLVMSSQPRHAKFAARLLAHTKKSDEFCQKVADKIAAGLDNADEETRLAHLTVLAQLARFSPDAFETQSEFFIKFLVSQVLMMPSPPDDDMMDTEEEWAEDSTLSNSTKSKMLAIKVCTNRSLAHAASPSVLEVTTPILRLLVTMLEHNGSMAADTDDDPRVRSRIRCQAAISILRLATIEAVRPTITPNFTLLALTVQDSCFQVRERFVDKLTGLLSHAKLPPAYNVILFITAHDPEREIRDKARKYVYSRLRFHPQEYRYLHFEMIFVRLLHLLARHPDFGLSPEALRDLAKYIELYLELCSSAENVALLYYLAQKAKSIRDSESQTYSDNLYAMSELAQHIIKGRAKLHSWALDPYPGKVKLPGDIFKALPSPEVANEIMKNAYLPEEAVQQLGELGRGPPKSPTVRTANTGPKAPRKRKASVSKPNGSSKRTKVAKKRRKDWDGSDDEEQEENEFSSVDGSGDEAANASAVADEDEDEDEEDTSPSSPKLGRGARGRAKAREKKKAKRASAGTAQQGPSEG